MSPSRSETPERAIGTPSTCPVEPHRAFFGCGRPCCRRRPRPAGHAAAAAAMPAAVPAAAAEAAAAAAALP